MILFQLISFDFILNCLAFIGIYVVSLYLFDNLKSIVMITKALLDPFFQPQLNIPLSEKFGNWAIVTGSTDGIGKEYAKELARKGINIVLISRSRDKLLRTANEIESEFKIKTKWIEADFSKGLEIYKHIENEVAGIPVGILVNNVGRMYDYPEELSKVPENLIWDIININVGATTMMCRMMIKNLKNNGKGAIVNISSGSELQPVPFMAVYAASKIYLKSLTLALQHELASFGITVQLVTPMYVTTKMNEYSSTVMQGGLLIPDAKTYARSLVFTLGKTNETTGYWSHGLQYAAMKLVPMWLRTSVGFIMTKDMRESYLKNCSKEQKKAKEL